ncbi:serine/threonine protein kinase [Trichophyton violaceum]|uniref:Serine/threonine protein kinase n=1 Tax=Trichophyton violaceum TaxID=34388 RepID=A0A178FQF0_TRIVO|nr:serine/threonine protein kinase [Trichophyton violaceum]
MPTGTSTPETSWSPKTTISDSSTLTIRSNSAKTLEIGDYPHVRPISMAEDTAQPGGTFGIASAATELFALGPIFWHMVRGTELWAGVQGLDLVDRLTARTCPEMDLEDPVNRIIRECWTGRFASVAALAASLHPPAGVFEGS